MIRYSTPKILIETDIDLSLVSGLWVSFQQGNITIRKTKSEVVVNANTVIVSLSQEETGGFDPYQNVYVQVRYLTSDGIAGGSEVASIIFDDSLENEVITDENSN